MNTVTASVGVAGAVSAGLVLRPWRVPEAAWAVAGATVLVAAGVLPWDAALLGAARAADVALFLAGMMVMAELARAQGVFDWVASHAARAARGHPARLLALVYGAGTVVTALLSNDATAVVLTPAVLAACRAAGVAPLPHLLACALVANAASFLLPMGNPANLVFFGGAVPPLRDWVVRFAPAGLAATALSFLALRLLFRRALRAEGVRPAAAALTPGGRAALAGLALGAGAMLGASAAGWPLGAPTAAAGLAALVVVVAGGGRGVPASLARVDWLVLPLVAGLFTIVAALDRVGVVGTVARFLARPDLPAWVAGAAVAVVSNITNNLPAGLLAAEAARQAQVAAPVRDALLIGIDLGPNVSVTGSLATLLWLSALRREGVVVGFWQFARVGAVATLPALAAALWLVRPG